MRNYVYLFCLFFGSITARAQSPFVPLNTDYYHLIDRYEIRQNRWAEGFHSSVKPYNRQSIIQLTDSLTANPNRDLSDSDYFNYDYLRNDSWEWVNPSADSLRSDPFTKHLRPLPGPGDSEGPPIFNIFYQKKADFYNLRTPDVDLHVNPVLYVGAGSENVTRQTNTLAGGRQSLFVNTRGLEVRGTIARK
ncbi:MAG: hypothetical protein JWP57_533, partial [Spirosoma sp.]|nr:hypothetical protein [Spirosoma sp.]